MIDFSRHITIICNSDVTGDWAQICLGKYLTVNTNLKNECVLSSDIWKIVDRANECIRMVDVGDGDKIFLYGARASFNLTAADLAADLRSLS